MADSSANFSGRKTSLSQIGKRPHPLSAVRLLAGIEDGVRTAAPFDPASFIATGVILSGRIALRNFVADLTRSPFP